MKTVRAEHVLAIIGTICFVSVQISLWTCGFPVHIKWSLNAILFATLALIPLWVMESRR